MQQRFSLYKINNSNEFGFSPSAYSRFKFGDSQVAQEFGVELGEAFIARYLQHNPIEKQIVVLSSPYLFIPTATFSLKDHFVYTLNAWLTENNFKVVQDLKVYRTVSYKEDYGELDAQERINLIGNDSFYLDKTFIEDKVLIFLDDIRITGSHERMINKMVQSFDLTNDIFLLYFAELTNSDIHPNVENYLNYFSVKSIFDLQEIIDSENFRINTRFVKYILNSETDSFTIFIDSQTERFISLFLNMVIGNNYHLIEDYQANMNYLKSIHSRAKTKLLQNGN